MLHNFFLDILMTIYCITLGYWHQRADWEAWQPTPK